MDKQTLSFQAEVQQILHLVTHSLYSNKEIFLRELVSNASDACDKLRFEALADTALWESDPDLKIRVAYDKAARALSVSDNGVGMSRDEVIANIGTIAKSGTREFFQSLTGDQAKDAHLIGQFGVGFYSGFIVADRITVESRRAGLKPEEGVRWASDGSGKFDVESITRAARGTDVILHLRDGEEDFLKTWKLKSIIAKYSDHISLPILMRKEKWEPEKSESVLTDEWETVNKAAALWTRAKSDVTDSEYQEFYKQLSYDADPPLAYTHNRVEGRTEYTQLLYIPAKADTLLDLAGLEQDEIRPVAEAMERGGRLAAKEQVTDAILDKCRPIAGRPADCSALRIIGSYRGSRLSQMVIRSCAEPWKKSR